MCGIVGILKWNNEKISEEEILSLTNSVDHRGPGQVREGAAAGQAGGAGAGRHDRGAQPCQPALPGVPDLAAARHQPGLPHTRLLRRVRRCHPPLPGEVRGQPGGQRPHDQPHQRHADQLPHAHAGYA